MPSLLDIRRRIRSVKNTQQLTKAMKTVSAAKLRRAQDRVFSARPYAEQLRTWDKGPMSAEVVLGSSLDQNRISRRANQACGHFDGDDGG